MNFEKNAIFCSDIELHCNLSIFLSPQNHFINTYKLYNMLAKYFNINLATISQR